MELNTSIDINEIIRLKKKLSYGDKLFIKKVIEKDLHHKPKRDKMSFRELLLSGPVMTQEGYDDYKKLRKKFTKWQTKLSV